MKDLTSMVIADIGNSHIKIAQVGPERRIGGLVSIAECEPIQLDLPCKQLEWYLCSVSPSETERLVAWLATNRSDDRVHQLSYQSVPLSVEVNEPGRVGLDRLMAAVAANELAAGRDVVVIDSGTAVTIDAVSNSRFLGGTIFPGMQTAFASLRAETEQLPLIEEYQYPEFVIGKSTREAILSGVIHGQVGAIKHIAGLVIDQLDSPEVVVTGGGIKPLGPSLPDHWKYVSDLVLQGIGLTASHVKARGE